MSDVGPIKAKTDRIWYRFSKSGAELARDSDPTAHFVCTEDKAHQIEREISLFAKGAAEMKD
jgi:hypothetical protein